METNGTSVLVSIIRNKVSTLQTWLLINLITLLCLKRHTAEGMRHCRFHNLMTFWLYSVL